jgi:hypothetical protein
MKQKLVLLIALVLALAQGAVAGDFTAIVGQQDSLEVTITFNPNAVVRMPKQVNDSSRLGLDVVTTLGYTVSVEGADTQMFSASILSATTSMTTYNVIMKLRIVYSPTAEGTHQAQLRIYNQNGESKYTINVTGVASEPDEPTVLPGDVNGDGLVTVADATELIDYILGNPSDGFNQTNADVDGDGEITIGDLSDLIDTILGVPDVQLYTYLIVTLSNGATQEYIIDEYSKVKIAKPFLIIEVNGVRMYFELEQTSNIRYEERMVSTKKAMMQRFYLPSFGTILTQDPQENSMNEANVTDGSLNVSPINAPSDEFEITADSQTLNTLQP